MAEDTLTTSGIGKHGVPRLPSVDIDSYNVELKDDDGFLGDRASKGAFRRILDDLRKPLRKNGDDPLGKTPSDEIAKGSLDEALVGDDIEAAALVHGAIEEFARELAYVTSRFLKTKAWADTECIVVGGGFRKSRVGEIAIARADLILKSEGHKIHLIPIRFDPDEAGLIGCLHLAPSWIFEAFDCILAVDIGGTNIRCGVVETNWKKAADLSKAAVWKSELWRHADDEPTRESAVKRLVKMLKDLIAAAEKPLLLLLDDLGAAQCAILLHRHDLPVDDRPDRPPELHHPLAGNAGFDQDRPHDLVAVAGLGGKRQGEHCRGKKKRFVQHGPTLYSRLEDDGTTMRPVWQANGKRVFIKLDCRHETFCQGYRPVWK